MSEYNIQMNKYNALNAEYDQLYPATKIKNVNGLDTALQNKADTSSVYTKSESDTLLQNKAPSGYGLGDVARWIGPTDDLNNIKTTGWYRWFDRPINAPGEFGAMTVVVTAPDGGLVQEVVFVLPEFNGTYNFNVNCKVRRICYQDTWQPWEWENPPMMLGVEYRTTERYMGKPVYIQSFHFEALPNASNENLEHHISNISNVLACGGTMENGNNIPYVSEWGQTYVSANTSYIFCYTSNDQTSHSATVWMKYTKTTD